MYLGKTEQIFVVSDALRNACAEIAESSGAWGADVFRNIKTDINQHHQILIVYRTEHNRLIGFIKGKVEGKNHTFSVPQLQGLNIARIDWIFVDPKFHNQGVGTKLVNTFTDFIQSQGVGGIYACISDIKKTRAFYRKNNYRPTKPRDSLYYHILPDKER